MDAFEALLSSGSAVAGGFFTFIIGRRKNKLEMEALQIKNIETIIEVWKEHSGTLEQKVSELSTKVEKLEKENRELRIEVMNYQKQIASLAPYKSFKRRTTTNNKSHGQNNPSKDSPSAPIT